MQRNAEETRCGQELKQMPKSESQKERTQVKKMESKRWETKSGLHTNLHEFGTN